MTLEEALKRISDFSTRSWLYLSRDAEWSLSTEAAILENDEISEEDEDLPEAGVPEFARINGLKQTLPVTVIQDIIANLKHSRPSPTPGEMLEAFKFYYSNDAFGPH